MNVTAFFPATLILSAAVIFPATFLLMRVYRGIIRHFNIATIHIIVRASAIASTIWFLFAYALSLFLQKHLSVSLWFLMFSISSILVCASRFIPNYFLNQDANKIALGEAVAIYGTNPTSRQIAAGLLHSDQYKPIFFIADDNITAASDIDGFRVYDLEHLKYAINRYSINSVIISSKDNTTNQAKAVISKLLDLNVKINICSSIEDKISSSQILRNIEIADLIGRTQKEPIEALLKSSIAGKKVLITGASGSIGSQLSKKISTLNPKSLELLDINETPLKDIYLEIKKQCSSPVKFHLCSILNSTLLETIVANGKYDIVFHAAAYKHVDVAEENVLSVARNNIFGTHTLLKAIHKYKVKSFVLISTDKAVEPVGVMGLTKLWCEFLVKSYATAKNSKEGFKYCCVRFGNVIESSGSVIPIFKKQIQNGGPITITDKKMTRYFMSLNEAADLIIQAPALSHGGEVFVLNMGEPIKIVDVAKNLIKLAGLQVQSTQSPQGQIEIVEIGAGPTEKLDEKLHFDAEIVEPTQHPSINKTNNLIVTPTAMSAAFKAITLEINAGNENKTYKLLKTLSAKMTKKHSHFLTSKHETLY